MKYKSGMIRLTASAAIGCCLIVVASIAGCGDQKTADSPPDGDEGSARPPSVTDHGSATPSSVRAQESTKPLFVAAASDLQSALPELIDRFRTKTGIAVNPPTFGASGQLAEQIKGGAPFDVFLAANQSFVRDLAQSGLIKPESVHPYVADRSSLRSTVSSKARSDL